MSKLVVVKQAPEIEAQRVEPEDDRPSVGSWWWVTCNEESDVRDRDDKWIGCVIEVGSNYVKLRGVHGTERMSLDDMPDRCTAEPTPQTFLDYKVNEHRTEVRQLMGEIQRVCRQLGVPMHQALAESEAANHALQVAHGVADVEAYQEALVLAKRETLPELFREVKRQHEHMATWMKAELIPAEAELKRAKGVTELIDAKIQTVELYAGLKERLECVREGEPASVDAKVHLMQRRHYMDEECLIRYTAGGMDFEDLAAFDKWLARDEHMTRIFPHERCIVAFRIRRFDKEYEIGDSLSRFIRFQFHNEYNKWTFLYIRNGRHLWRLRTQVEFGAELFPSREDSEVIGDDELWAKPEGASKAKFISGQAYAYRVECWHKGRAELAARLWQWKRQGKPEKEWINPERTDKSFSYKSHEYVIGLEVGRPDEYPDDEWKRFERVTPEHIFYDDAMTHVREVTTEHNRVAVVIQGLLDRSTCLHPHPPWRIWTPEGFDAGITLVYDVSRALTPGEAPDWEGYREQLNKSIRPGAVVLGQANAWHAEMEEKYDDRWKARKANGKGPKRLDRITSMRNGKAQFKWQRESQRGHWVPSDRKGWLNKKYAMIEQSWWCPIERLTCIDAYTPGDFHIFFDDPRTRANYIRWAPILLTAEDYHANRRLADDEDE